MWADSLTITTNASVGSVILTSNGAVLGATMQSQTSTTRTWTVSTPVLAGGANTFQVIAFSKADYPGLTAQQAVTYTFSPPGVAAITAHILGQSTLAGDALRGADRNGDGVVDVADVVRRSQQAF